MRRRPLKQLLMPAGALVAAVALFAPAALAAPEIAVEDDGATLVLPFSEGEVTLDHFLSPIHFQTLRVKRKPASDGQHRLEVAVRAGNGSGEDYKVFVTAELLDESGAVLTAMSDKEAMEDDDGPATVKLKTRVPAATLEAVQTLRLRLAVQED